MRIGAAALLLGPALVFRCIGVEPLPPPECGELALPASDFAAGTAELARLPRRPRLLLRLPDGFGDPGAVFLFEGAPEPELVADLERSPLSSEHLAQSLPCDLEPY